VALSVTNTAHAAVLVNGSTNDQVNFASFLNTGAAPIAFKCGTTSSVAAPTFPVDGTIGDFVLPSGMTSPMIIATPTVPFYITAVSNSATAGILYVTPAGDQS
jgi:hypothetical protein